jgi:hypothetical protein
MTGSETPQTRLRITIAALLAALLIAAAPATARAASPQFTDWTASTATSASGTLLGHPVSLTGNSIHSAVTDGSWQVFNSPDFTPQLANSDMVEFGGANGYAYRLDLGAPTQDPVLDLYSLGSTLTFPAGTQLVKLSGQPGFQVSGNTVGAASGDVNGTVRVVGVFATLTFSTTIHYVGGEDGIDLQAGGTSPGSPPPPACSVCDSDHDGVVDGVDCDDLNPSIHQGAPDVPGNGIDEDCSKGDARLPRLQRDYHSAYRNGSRHRLRFKQLVVKKARPGDVMKLGCRGRGCPLRHRTLTVRRKTRRFNVLTPRFSHAWLHRGAVVTLRIEHPGTRARNFRWKIRGASVVESDHWDR